MSFKLSKPLSRQTDLGDPGPIWPPTRGCIGIQAHTWKKGSLGWQESRIYHGSSLSSESTRDTTLDCLTVSDTADVTVFVMPHEKFLKCCGSCMESLHEAFAFLPTWWQEPYTYSNGYFGFKDDFDGSGNSQGVYTWSRFLLQLISSTQQGEDQVIEHKWRDIIPFTYWHKETNKVRILLLRTEETVVQRLLVRILDTLQQGIPEDPLWPHENILEEVISCQHNATLAVRDLILFEEEFGRQLKPVAADYPRLHEVAKHATTVAEILEVNVRTIATIMDCHKAFIKSSGSDLNAKLAPHRNPLHQKFLFQSHMIYSICSRCVSYKDRMKNEIQLAYNLVAQEDTKNSIEIAAAARADSRAMTFVAIITSLFLPGTFISAVFSTSFFDFGGDPDSWTMSRKIYVYWATLIPATVVCAAIFLRSSLWRSLNATSVEAKRLVRQMTMVNQEEGTPSDTSSEMPEKRV